MRTNKGMEYIGQTLKNSFNSTMIVTEYRKYNDIDVYFPDYEWTAEHVRYGDFKKGQIKCPFERKVYGVGYLGDGPYEATENGKKTKVYDTWYQMLKRCYDKKYHAKNPTYINCTVCEEWLNFQNFGQWYENNFYQVPDQQMDLDKDILFRFNKVYSPETCIFVPHNINTLFTKSDKTRGDLPIGVCYDKRTKIFRAQCSVNNKQVHIGYYDTPEEALVAYKVFKEEVIKLMADDYKDYIPESLYDAMYNYEVNLYD